MDQLKDYSTFTFFELTRQKVWRISLVFWRLGSQEIFFWDYLTFNIVVDLPNASGDTIDWKKKFEMKSAQFDEVSKVPFINYVIIFKGGQRCPKMSINMSKIYIQKTPEMKKKMSRNVQKCPENDQKMSKKFAYVTYEWSLRSMAIWWLPSTRWKWKWRDMLVSFKSWNLPSRWVF